MNYKLYSWKLSVRGEYDNEEEAIKELADKYMQCSRCDPPGDSIPELLMGQGSINQTLTVIGKGVRLAVEEEIYGILQWVDKYQLNIHPFRREHWWDSQTGFEPQDSEFRYEILNQQT